MFLTIDEQSGKVRHGLRIVAIEMRNLIVPISTGFVKHFVGFFAATDVGRKEAHGVEAGRIDHIIVGQDIEPHHFW